MGKIAKPEEIIAKLREVEVRLARGETAASAARAVGVTEQTYYRWRKEYGGLQVDQAKRMKDMEKENARLRRAVSDLTLDNQILQEVVRGKFLSPSRRCAAVDHVVKELGVSERRACRVIGQHRSTQRKQPIRRDDEDALTSAIIRLAERFGRYGYRRITALLRNDGWHVNEKRVYRIWRREGLKVPMKQPKRGRLWLNDGSCVRLRPAHKGYVWSYDFVQDRTHDGRVFRMLCVVDEFTRECLAIRVERKLNSRDVLDTLGELFVRHGAPEHIRSDNGPEFIATALRDWLERVGVKTLYIEPGSPWENGYCESFNSKLRDELLAREIFFDLREAKILIEAWRQHYNTARPHSSLGYKPPAPKAILPAAFMPPYYEEVAA
ncbi:MAG: IS3 family transposase [Alphaproteobacteria bacterium]|nr:IS3 family transposase [Alphaproteobacteria bacterium]MBU2083744.1 IS3 family transposase [Alphaproteobacteria bacterium]MBU2143834.1 IS3 family transposase [Alphaproteobacteria bacterium]MBU2197949.1 IS3 family transposase [Alphaproteobacteria bacterium]